jgi:hypothetical protein
MRTTAAIVVACMALGLAGLSAQSHPNFAGKWTLADAGGGGGRGAGGGFGGLGQDVVVSQTASTLTATSMSQMGEIKRVYQLDGSESKNTLSFGDQSIVQTSTAKWDGSTLVIVTKSDFAGMPFETTMKLSLDAAGTMTVESTRPDFQGGGAPITTKTTYRKS